jgi:CheY-like chemotaxis protein
MVLVVEEEDGVRELYAEQLAAAGFMVLEAPDGSTAVEKALQFVPHAIVLDLVLPGIDGLKVVCRLRADERTQAVAIVAFAALNAQDGASGSGLGTLAIAAGCDSFFSKRWPRRRSSGKCFFSLHCGPRTSPEEVMRRTKPGRRLARPRMESPPRAAAVSLRASALRSRTAMS